jgi:2-keto-4-pentenoate hydratase
MPYVPPGEVVSPKASWTLVDVILDRGAGKGAYAIGMWDRHRRVAFRWNGTDESPLGNPQSRGLATWVMLEPLLNSSILAVVEAKAPSKTAIMRAFLGRPVEDDD